MAITNLSDIISNATAGRRQLTVFNKICPNAAGNATVWHTMWPFAGIPAAGPYTGATLTSTSCNSSLVGAIWNGGAVSSFTKYLTRLSISASSAQVAPGILMLYDRLLYYPNVDCTTTLSQGFTNSVTLPRYTTGNGVRAWLEVTSTFGAAAGVFTYGTSGYTNQSGTTGRQHGVTVATTVSSPVTRLPHSGSTTLNNGWNPFLPMQVGDTGIRSVESARFTTASGGGACALVLGFPLAVMPIPDQNAYAERDLVFQTPSLPRIYDGACLNLLYCPLSVTTANAFFVGDIETVWG